MEPFLPRGPGLGLYILDGHTPVQVDDVMQWARWFEKADRHVAKTLIGDVWISTMFLGIGYGDSQCIYGSATPMLFETMAFRGENGLYQERCTTWEQAEAMHAKTVAHFAAAEHFTVALAKGNIDAD